MTDSDNMTDRLTILGDTFIARAKYILKCFTSHQSYGTSTKYQVQ